MPKGRKYSAEFKREADALSKPFLVATRIKQEDSADLAKQAGLRRRARIGQLHP